MGGGIGTKGWGQPCPPSLYFHCIGLVAVHKYSTTPFIFILSLYRSSTSSCTQIQRYPFHLYTFPFLRQVGVQRVFLFPPPPALFSPWWRIRQTCYFCLFIAVWFSRLSSSPPPKKKKKLRTFCPFLCTVVSVRKKSEFWKIRKNLSLCNPALLINKYFCTVQPRFWKINKYTVYSATSTFST